MVTDPSPSDDPLAHAAVTAQARVTRLQAELAVALADRKLAVVALRDAGWTLRKISPLLGVAGARVHRILTGNVPRPSHRPTSLGHGPSAPGDRNGDQEVQREEREPEDLKVDRPDGHLEQRENEAQQGAEGEHQTLPGVAVGVMGSPAAVANR